MSVYHLTPLACGSCGACRPVKTVDSANPLRHPPFLDALVGRTFNRFPCPACGEVDTLELPMLWTDVEHALVAWMLPSWQRPGWSLTEIDVGRGLVGPVREEGPAFVRAWGQGAALRLVYGLEELRDKVVACRAGIDDRVLEILKLPYVDAEAASGPVLEAVDGAGLHLATPPAGTSDERRADAREVAVVPWDAYQGALGAESAHQAAHPGLFTGTWVHWIRAPFAVREDASTSSPSGPEPVGAT